MGHVSRPPSAHGRSGPGQGRRERPKRRGIKAISGRPRGGGNQRPGGVRQDGHPGAGPGPRLQGARGGSLRTTVALTLEGEVRAAGGPATTAAATPRQRRLGRGGQKPRDQDQDRHQADQATNQHVAASHDSKVYHEDRTWQGSTKKIPGAKKDPWSSHDLEVTPGVCGPVFTSSRRRAGRSPGAGRIRRAGRGPRRNDGRRGS